METIFKYKNKIRARGSICFCFFFFFPFILHPPKKRERENSIRETVLQKFPCFMSPVGVRYGSFGKKNYPFALRRIFPAFVAHGNKSDACKDGARALIFYSTFGSEFRAKFAGRIPKKLLFRKVRNIHGDELFGRGRGSVERVQYRRRTRRTTKVGGEEEEEVGWWRRTRVHSHTCNECNGAVLTSPAS